MPYQPTRGQLHVSRPLTNMSIAYWQRASNFKAARIFPNVPVEQETDLFYTFDRGWFNRNQMEKRADATRTKSVAFEANPNNTYQVTFSGLNVPISDRQRRRARSNGMVNLDRNAVRLLTLAGLINRENAWVSKFFKTGVWTNELAGVSGAVGAGQFKKWSDPTSTPIEDVSAAKQKTALTGFEANKLVLGRVTYDALKHHPDIVDRIKYGQTAGGPAIVNVQTLAALFEVESIEVMNAVQNTGKEGLANVDEFIAGAHALLCYANPEPAVEMPSAGYTFSLTGGGRGLEGQVVEVLRDEPAQTDLVQVEIAYDMKKTGDDLAVFWKDAA